MKRILIASCIVVALCLIGWATYQVATPAADDRSFARLMPQGALVYLEAKDLSGLLREWNASPEKAAWMKSDNYEVLSRSRLLLRLEQAQNQFAAAAGVPPDTSSCAKSPANARRWGSITSANSSCST